MEGRLLAGYAVKDGRGRVGRHSGTWSRYIASWSPVASKLEVLGERLTQSGHRRLGFVERLNTRGELRLLLLERLAQATERH